MEPAVLDRDGEQIVEDYSASIQDLVLQSLKRTYNLFSKDLGLRTTEDFESQRAKIAVKVHDDYELVRDMPPPPTPAPRPAAGPSSSAPVSSSSASSSSGPRAKRARPSASIDGSVEAISEPEATKILVAPAAPFPSGPGVRLSEATAAHRPMPAENAIDRVIQSLPSSQKQAAQDSKQSQSVVAYQERYASQSLIRKPTRQQVMPEWHAPWKMYRVISGHQGWVRCSAVDSTNQWFATGSADRTVKVWDLATGTLKVTLTGHVSTVRGVAISARHPYMYSCGEDKQVKCWDLEVNKVIRSYHGHLSDVYCLALHPTLDLLFTGGRDSSVRVWDVRTKAQVHVLSGHTNTIWSIAAQAGEPQVISGSADTTARCWDLAAGKARAVLTNHKKSVRSVGFHPKEYAFATAGPDNIKKWACPDATFLHNMSGHNALVNSMAINDDIVVSAADNGSMAFFDWKTGYKFQDAETVPQPGSLDSEKGIFCMSFDQTGSRLITGETDKSIKMWKQDESATPESHPIRGWKDDLDSKRY